MECLAVSKLPKGSEWILEIKLDGYRAEAMKSGGNLSLLSRRQKSFSKQFPLIHHALADLPDNTVIDGEIIALDEAANLISISCKTFEQQPSASTILWLTCSCLKAAT